MNVMGLPDRVLHLMHAPDVCIQHHSLTLLSGMLWHRGMRLAVCLAAMMPASCAVASTSPFAEWAALADTSSYAVLPSRTRHEAEAVLVDGCFCTVHRKLLIRRSVLN
jgi:hypothetical protein